MSIVQYRLELFKRHDSYSLGFDDCFFLRPKPREFSIIHSYPFLLVHRSLYEAFIRMPDAFDINAYRLIVYRHRDALFAVTDAEVRSSFNIWLAVLVVAKIL